MITLGPPASHDERALRSSSVAANRDRAGAMNASGGCTSWSKRVDTDSQAPSAALHAIEQERAVSLVVQGAEPRLALDR